MSSYLNSILGNLSDKAAQAAALSAVLQESPLKGAKARAARMAGCAESVTVSICPVCQSAHLDNLRLCRDRLCPICQWRLARKRAAILMGALTRLQEQESPAPYPALLTLTTRNVQGEKLSETVSAISRAFTELIRSREVSKAVKGSARTIEVTHNSEADTWHPHIHALLLYAPQGYISHERWVTLWQKHARLEYPPTVDIRAIRTTETDPTSDAPPPLYKACLEVCKYITSPSLIENIDTHLLSTLGTATANVRMHTLTGVLRKAGKAVREEYEPPTPICKCGATQERILVRRDDTGAYTLV